MLSAQHNPHTRSPHFVDENATVGVHPGDFVYDGQHQFIGQRRLVPWLVLNRRRHFEIRPVLILALKVFHSTIPPTGVWTSCRGVNKFLVTESSVFRLGMNPISISATVVETR